MRVWRSLPTVGEALVRVDGDELDDRLGDAETTLDLGDQRGGRFDDEQDVEAVVEPGAVNTGLAAAQVRRAVRRLAGAGVGVRAIVVVVLPVAIVALVLLLPLHTVVRCFPFR